MEFRPHLLVTYRLRCDAAQAQQRAHALSIEQSVEMPPDAITNAALAQRVVGRVVSITADASSPGHQLAVLELAAQTCGDDPVQLMNMLFGNCALQDDVTLIDVALPDDMLAAMPGPRFGIDGLRAAIGPGAQSRPLACTALKPQGLGPAELAQLAYLFARSGIDVIKDDHGIADQAAAPFDQRVPAVQHAIERANHDKAQSDDPFLSGHRTLYAPHLNGGPQRILRQLDVLHAEGVGAALAAPMLIGIGCFADLVRQRASVPLIAHPALAGQRIRPSLLFGRLFRLFGADATIFPNWGGRFTFSRDECLAIAAEARKPLGVHRATMPVPAGGIRVERSAELVRAYGTDSMLLIGGDLLAAGASMPQRARAFVDALRVADAPILRRALPDGGWDSVEVLKYKPDGEAPYRDVTRRLLFASPELACEWRYFEVGPDGHSTLERHEHAHAVMILRGRGRCLVGSVIHSLAEHDLVRIPPNTWHQLRADADASLGFLCLVNRERDRPQLPSEAELAVLRSDPAISAFIKASK